MEKTKYGTIKLIGVKYEDKKHIRAKTQEIGKIRFFVDREENPSVRIDARSHVMTTRKGTYSPDTIGSPSNKGTTYCYNTEEYHIEVVLKKMVGSLTFTLCV